MIVNYDIEKIRDALTAFYNATGINIALLKADASSVDIKQSAHNRYCCAIQEQNKKTCTMSDKMLIERCSCSKKAEMHICHAGLVDIAVPVLYEDEILAYIILGQMKSHEDFGAVREKTEKLKLDSKAMERYYDELTLFDGEKIKSVEKIAVMLAKYLLLENMLKPDLDLSIKKATDFIEANIQRNLTVSYIAKNIGISKSVLYRRFHTHFNCTVSEYINKTRIKKAEELLLKTQKSIEEISERIGFSSASYFSRVFKEKNKVSPLVFRKQGGM